MKLTKALFVLTLFSGLGDGAPAQTPGTAQPANKSGRVATQKAALASAEVVAVYPEEKRLLLKHAPIPGLGMSAMTMEFGVRNAGMLKSLKPGDRILFSAERVKDDYVVTSLQAAK